MQRASRQQQEYKHLPKLCVWKCLKTTTGLPKLCVWKCLKTTIGIQAYMWSCTVHAPLPGACMHESAWHFSLKSLPPLLIVTQSTNSPREFTLSSYAWVKPYKAVPRWGSFSSASALAKIDGNHGNPSRSDLHWSLCNHMNDAWAYFNWSWVHYWSNPVWPNCFCIVCGPKYSWYNNYHLYTLH